MSENTSSAAQQQRTPRGAGQGGMKRVLLLLVALATMMGVVSLIESVIAATLGARGLLGIGAILLVGTIVAAFVLLRPLKRIPGRFSALRSNANEAVLSRRSAVTLLVIGGLGFVLATGGMLRRNRASERILDVLSTEELAALRALGRKLELIEGPEVVDPGFLSLIFERPADEVRAALMPVIREESEGSIVVVLDGWRLPRTAAKIAYATL